MGVGLNVALLKDNKSGDPRFVFFQMIVPEIKYKKNLMSDFQLTLKIEILLLENYQNISCSILTRPGKTNSFSHFLENLRS